MSAVPAMKDVRSVRRQSKPEAILHVAGTPPVDEIGSGLRHLPLTPKPESTRDSRSLGD
jgi:hypothetical protein